MNLHWMRSRLAFLICSFVPAIALMGQYQGPESVEYDPVGDRYFVSNTASASIKVRAQDGVVTDFITGMDVAPYGLELNNGVLYACMGGAVRGYDALTGEEVFNVDLGASFLNGITTDGEFLYLTDFSTERIYKVEIANETVSTLNADTQGQPNGIVWDEVDERLVVVFWGSNAPIKSFDRVTGAAQTLVANSGVGSIDGVTIDCGGNFLIASWSPDRITRFDANFSGAGVNTGITGLANPADIDFDPVNNKVCIPNSGSNTVLLADVDCDTQIPERRSYTTHIIPNPTTGLVRFEPPFTQAEPFMVVDARGLLQATGTLRVNALLDLGKLPQGIYTIVFSRLAQQVRVVKE